MSNDSSDEKGGHICVCICTFKRPETLQILLDKIRAQVTSGLLTFSVNVVDNDLTGSARHVVEQFEKRSDVPIRYQIEPRQNISLARNMVISTASGDYFALIDDDEFPTETWLISLFRMMKKHRVAGVLGPVQPYFDKRAPSWLIRSGICNRPSWPSGTFLTSERTRTGNVLLDSRIFRGMTAPFDPQQGRRGGEDISFFRRLANQGARFVWCQEAPVFEVIGPPRWKKTYYIRRSALNGTNSGRMLREDFSSSWPSVLRSALSVPVFLSFLPFALLFGQHVFIRDLCRVSYHFSRVCGFGGLPIVGERDD